MAYIVTRKATTTHIALRHSILRERSPGWEGLNWYPTQRVGANEADYWFTVERTPQQALGYPVDA